TPRASFARALHGLASRPRLDAETPEAHEPFAVLVPETVGGLVGRQVVVVQPDLTAAAGDESTSRHFALEAHLAGDEALALLDEGVESLLQRGKPETVVDEVGVARLQAR